MIDGVVIKKLTLYPDDRGFFAEIAKDGEGVWKTFKQVSATQTYPEVIKAFHWHKRQYDLWYCVSGNIQAVLYDQREKSPTKGETQVVYMGENAPIALLIPPGVIHGYRVLGTVNANLIYMTTEAYDAKDPDEERLAFDDPKIGFDWNTQNR